MQQPSFQSNIVNALEYFAEDINTAIPCIIVKVNNLEELSVDVQPVINQLFKDDTTLQMPVIYNVPVMFPATTRSALTFPLAVGDNVLCVFSQRGMDTFKRSSGYPTTPNDLRKLSLRDAIAIPGLFPFKKSPNQQSKRSLSHSTDDVVLAHNLGTANECEYRLKINGDVSIKAKTFSVVATNINMTGSTSINGGVATTGSLTNNGVNVGSTHVHPPSNNPPA